MVNTETDRALIGQALAQLSAEHRAVVRRSSYQAWTTTQIADDLQIAEDTVKSRLHYALRALRFTLQEMGVDTTPQCPVAFPVCRSGEFLWRTAPQDDCARCVRQVARSTE